MIPTYEKLTDMKNDYTRGFAGTISGYLQTIAADSLVNNDMYGFDSAVVQWRINKCRKWHNTVKLDMVRDIENLTLWKRLVDRLSASRGHATSLYECNLARAMVPRYDDDTTLTSAQLADMSWQYVQMNRRRLIVDNLVNLLWVGTKREKGKAIAVLNRETGQQFKTPKEWMVWWRNNRPELQDF
jgi:hypothetical protein